MFWKHLHCPSKTILSASAGNRTRVNCLEGSYAHHYTTDTWWAIINDNFSYNTGRCSDIELICWTWRCTACLYHHFSYNTIFQSTSNLCLGRRYTHTGVEHTHKHTYSHITTNNTRSIERLSSGVPTDKKNIYREEVKKIYRKTM